MRTRSVCPDWVKIAPAVLDDGRSGAALVFPDVDGTEVRLVLDLSMLGQINAEADGLRQTAMAWD